MEERYQPHAVEVASQGEWRERELFRAREDAAGEKFYCLSMFPYPSGRLHMGHVRNYTIGDVIARYHRMRGRNVLQPMGWDAFGLPAENAAVKHGVPPAKWTRENIAAMREQCQRMGWGYDWRRELATCDPAYYRWEQWLFTKMFEQGLVYRARSVVNWDPVDQTVLANEQVIDGRGWRSGAPVEQREIPQWFVRITAYADELVDKLDELEGWPEAVRTMQRNWIGRSEGVELQFEVEGGREPLTVFTTRPDTLMGATYMAVAAEHPLAREAAEHDSALREFLDECRRVQTSEAALETMDKRGKPLGIDAVHPVTGERLPIWAANFVLMTYGTGAIMAVPGHDQRDWEFARYYGLPIRQVIAPADGSQADIEQGAFEDYGVLINSGELDGLSSAQAFDALAERFQARGTGRRRINYRLRDWGVSRQRYWGCPIPIVYCNDCGPVPVPDEDLPVRLPEDVAFEGVRSPLREMPEFYRCRCPQCGAEAERETDTFDTFMESSWYYARFCCPDSDGAMLDQRADQWLPVSQYIGGIEHATMHLLYARFFHKVLRDLGMVSSDEPFTNLLTQGMVHKDGAKMSKSKGNTVDPQAMIDTYGADTVRLFTMFAAPPDQALDWSDSAVEGSNRFLHRLWRLVHQHVGGGAGQAVDVDALNAGQRELRRHTHETIAKVTDDVGRRHRFNTAIAAVMELVNAIGDFDDRSEQGRAVAQEALEATVLLLAPIVPHIARALWQGLGHGNDPLEHGWPAYDDNARARDTVTVVVQVNGKLRGRVELPPGAPRERVEAAAFEEPNVARFLAGKRPDKVVVVPDKLVNIVAKS